MDRISHGPDPDICNYLWPDLAKGCGETPILIFKALHKLLRRPGIGYRSFCSRHRRTKKPLRADEQSEQCEGGTNYGKTE